ncbi:MAG: SCO family protein [Oligoflexia bacterium]|nr:SCO family protein [Oligoflexia bacterium]
MIKKISSVLIVTFFISTGAANPKTFYDLGYKWKTDQGKTVTLKSFKGQKVVATMVYASCQTACPLIIKKLQKVHEVLSKHKVAAQFFIVSFDSKRDSYKKLGHFKMHNDLNEDNWTLAVGSEADTRAYANILGIKYSQNPESGEIMHDNKIILIDEKGKIVKSIEGLDASIEKEDLF